MGHTSLGHTGALTPGAQTWFVPDLKHSWWARKIDWYVGFQMARSQAHISRTYSPELCEIMNTWEVPPPGQDLPNRDSPLLISCAAYLPTLRLVMLPVVNSPEEWLRAIQSCIAKLNSRYVRIFLPAEFSPERAHALWENQVENLETSFVAEPTPS